MARRQPIKKPARTVAGIVKQVQGEPRVRGALAAYRVTPSADKMLWLAIAVKRSAECSTAMSKKVAAKLVG